MNATDPSGSGDGATLGGFEALALPFVDRVYRAAYHLTRDADEAENLTQETYLRAFRAFRGFRGPNAQAWLMKILHNAFVDQYRRRQHQPALVEMHDQSLEAEPSLAPGGASLHSAEDEVLAGWLDEEVDAALMRLPAEWRLVIVLADLEGFSYREIADITRSPIGTVMSRLHRSRQRLQAELRQFARTAGIATTEANT